MKQLRVTCFKFLAASFMLLAAGTAIAQQQPDADALLKEAQSAAHAGKYNLSRSLAREVLQVAPNYIDAAILIGNTYAWEQKYDSAQFILQALLKQTPQHGEVYLALAKVALWSGQNPEVVLDYANRGLAVAPQSAELKEYNIRALALQRKYNEAYTLLETLPSDNNTRTDLTKMLDEQAMVNRIRTEYQFISFDKNFGNWHQSSLEYTRLLHKGSITGRLNYASRFGQNAMQVEADFWPKLNENTYLYLNAGFSDSELFPDYRAGLEVYRKVPGDMEISLGGRALHYTNQTVWLYTGHIGKYLGKYWIAVRPFVQHLPGSTQATGILQLRRYLKNPEEHISLSLAKGGTPVSMIGLQEINRLDANRISLEGNFKMGRSFYWGALLQYEHEEYAENTFRNRLTTGLSLQYRFR